MSDLIKTLKSSSTGDDVYPNIKEDNIPTGAVTSAKIGTSAVTTGKINDGAVTTNKIADGSVNYDKLATALKNLIDGKASSSDLIIVQNALNTHVGNTSNPHSVTKAQVGLGNVDNTSDANKPVSTATQGALDLKADKSTTYTKTEVDTALSGKASLSGNNTFTGVNSFNQKIEISDNGNSQDINSEYDNNYDELMIKIGYLYIPDILKVDELNSIYLSDSRQYLGDILDHKSDILYCHNICMTGDDDNTDSRYFGCQVITNSSTPFTISTFLSYLVNEGFTSDTHYLSGNGYASATGNNPTIWGVWYSSSTYLNFRYDYDDNTDCLISTVTLNDTVVQLS